MTEQAAIEYFKKRIQELGYNGNYRLRVRHLVLKPSEKIVLEAFNQLYLIIETSEDITVESEMGMFTSELNTDLTNELLYEHQGNITIENTSTEATGHIKCLQAIIMH